MSDTTDSSEFSVDSKIVIAIIAVTVTTIAAAICTKKYILDKKQPTSYEKRVLRRKQRSMMKAIISIEDDAKKMLEDIKKVQGIILDFLRNNGSKKEQNDTKSDNDEKTVVDSEVKKEEEEKEREEEKVEKKEDENSTETKASDPKTKTKTKTNETKNEKEVKPATLQSIRVDGFLIEMKIKGLDEFLLRLLEQLDSLRPNALMDEAREMCADKEGLDDVIPYIEHKVEKIKKRKKALVHKIQNYLDNVDKLASTVSGKNEDIKVVESVAKLWEVEEEATDASVDDEKKNN
ncbi:hypothetical protein LY90DRAFT_703253 [Neocallimastix californiae]|uniref:BAG domain-containing protein n=1 Tax=Neocallimastix californiae TaxID=1754190 RepID=A0A1Y2CMD1_9FUNG|nr:hypothetical protein LY90DRAFT_703253 [Neocallimastix californiae]|eukprot:ORY47515.1 hypothetical protein LY90DRAFT_703253 [Neocallimastix californiae]